MNRGFTLIELLVVVSIIAVLSSVTMATFSHGRIRARNAVRAADLYQVRKALELYYYKNDSYPLTLAELDDPSEKYVSYVPMDPKTNATYFYQPYLNANKFNFNLPGQVCNTQPCYGYHIAANMEHPADNLLNTDSDIDSTAVSGVDTEHCANASDVAVGCFDFTN